MDILKFTIIGCVVLLILIFIVLRQIVTSKSVSLNYYKGKFIILFALSILLSFLIICV